MSAQPSQDVAYVVIADFPSDDDNSPATTREVWRGGVFDDADEARAEFEDWRSSNNPKATFVRTASIAA